LTSVLLLFFLVTTGSGPVSAQAQLLLDSRVLERYRAVVDAYRSGQAQAAVNDALRLEPSVLQAVDRLATRALKGNLTDSTLDAAFFRAAAMLHADVAFHCWRSGCDHDARPHLDRARRLVDASDRPNGAASTFRRHWYVATTLVVSTVIVPDDALEYFEEWVKGLPDDVPLLTAAGWFSERLSTVAAAPRSTLRSQQTLHRRYQLTAERFLTTALKLQPGAAEAALRLARVETLMGRDAEARRRLLPLVARSDIDTSVAYVGRLLLGGIHERERNAGEAAHWYREAVAVDEVGQSARVALGRLLYASGDAAGAADVIQPLLARGGERRQNDPWSEYLLAYVPVGQQLLDDLRKEVRR